VKDFELGGSLKRCRTLSGQPEVSVLEVLKRT
jgi:hypothetical protein